MKSKHIILEGISGSGKDSNAELVMEYARGKGYNPTIISEPSKEFREVIDTYRKRTENRSVVVEMELFKVCRMQVLKEELLPLLKEENNLAVCVRSLLSSLVYQAKPNNPIEKVLEVNSFYPTPDLTMIFVCDPKIAVKRIHARPVAISQEETFEKITRLKTGYEGLIDHIGPGCERDFNIHYISTNEDRNTDDGLATITGRIHTCLDTIL